MLQALSQCALLSSLTAGSVNLFWMAADWLMPSTPQHSQSRGAGDEHIISCLTGIVRRFDPLRLGSSKELLPWFKEAELTNGRWAMTAVPGILAIEALGKADPWWNAGATVSPPTLSEPTSTNGPMI